MDFAQRTLRGQRVCLAVTVAAGALLLWRGSLDIFNTVKATAILIGLLAVLVVGAVRVARTRTLVVPVTPLWIPLAALAVALTTATLVADQTFLAVVGRPGRHTGLMMYLAYLALTALALRLHVAHAPVELSKGLVAAAVPVLAYAALQLIGADPWEWGAVEGGPQVFATFGNANFLSAFLGIVTPVALSLALWVRRSPLWTVVGAGVALTAPLLAFASGSLQGPISAAVGAALVLAVWLWTNDRIARTARLLTCVALALGGAVLVVALVAGLGPLAAIREAATDSLGSRVGKWEAAVAMVVDRPLLGFGLDSYEDWFFAYRPEAVAAQTGLRRSTDAPHMVPLEMFASGGLVLGLAYLVFVGAVGWALVAGLRRLQGRDRLLLGGLGGAWLGYQVQSLVSIDVPPIAVLHYVLAGVLVGWGTVVSVREVALPGAPAPDLRRAPASRAGRGRPRGTPSAPLRPLHPGAVVLLGLVTLAALWLATTPLRADLTAARAVRLAATGRAGEADAAWARAGAAAFWEASYPARRADLAMRQGDAARALELHEEAARREPRGIAHHLNIARTAKAIGHHDRARRAYARLLEIDPHTPDVLAEVGTYEAAEGDPERGRALLERALSLREEAEWWSALGDARAAAGDVAGARDAFARALAMDPSSDEAQQGLEGLMDGSPPDDA